MTLEEEFGFRGKRVRVKGGIFYPDAPERRVWRGYHPFYNGRLIGEGRITNRGVGDYGCGEFCFLVELVDGEEKWQLATNKDDVEELDLLLEHCFDCCTEGLLKKAAEEAREFETLLQEELVNELLAGTGNQTRKKGEKEGRVSPTETGPKKVRTRTATTSGDYLDRARSGGAVQFRLKDLGGVSLGDLVPVGRNRMLVTLNTSNKLVRRNRTNVDFLIGEVGPIYHFYHELRKQDLGADEIIARVLDGVGADFERWAERMEAE